MRKIFFFILLFAVLGMAQNTVPNLAVWLTSSESLTKEECKFLSEIVREGADRELSGSVNVVKGKKRPADFYVESNVTKMGSKYHIVVELRKTQGAELLNSYSNRTSDVDLLTDGLEKAMEGFFDAVKAVLAESVPVVEDIVEPEVLAVPDELLDQQELNEPVAEFDENEADADSVNVGNIDENVTEVVELEEVVQDSDPKNEIDFSNVQYLDDGKGEVLKPNGTGDLNFDAYETFVWSDVVTQGVGADGGPSGGSGGKSGGLPVWVKVVPYVLGAGFIIAGVCENGQVKKERKNYDSAATAEKAVRSWDNLEFLRTTRNVFYGVGVGLVGVGAILTIAF